jgi:hypothetical protein
MSKIKLSLLAIAIYAFPFMSRAEEKPIPKTLQTIDLSLGAGSGMMTGALTWNRTHGISASNKLRLGYGLRFSGVSGSDQFFTTAPASLTSSPEKIDSISVASPMILSFNASIHIEYMFNSKFKAGFNIDGIGIGFGAKKSVDFISRNNDGTYPNTLEASPNTLNLLLIGDNDLGYLKSEFYVGYAIKNNLWVRVGMDMTFAEYTTVQTLTHNNDRFRIKPVLFFAGISYNLFN